MNTKTHNKQASEKEQPQKRVERKSQYQEPTFQSHPTEARQRVVNAPSPGTVSQADILTLQSSVGNRAVQRLLDGVPTGGLAPAVIQRHISEERQAIMFENNDQLKVESAEIKEAHTTALEGGEQAAEANELVASNVRSASGAYGRLNAAANRLLGQVNQAMNDPCECEAEEGG